MSGICDPAGPMWGQFQSLAQLAVATNGAFSAISGFVGADIPKERKEIERVERVLSHSEDVSKGVMIATKNIPVTVFVRSLKAECDHSEAMFGWLMSIIVRPLCLLGLLTAMIYLIVSCFVYNENISNINIFAMFVTNMPFFVG